MKIQLSAALLAALVLGGCAPQSDAGKQQVAAAADGQAQAQAPAPAKKKCADANTGSRLGSCNGSSDMVQGASGDAMKDQFRGGSAMTGAPHN
ncbi:MAG TPA: hypothetical protein VKP60_03025 [Magnetospirillaceae bacterium]|nr:hypothetical protein [Magnetospirillaceae bacterium]